MNSIVSCFGRKRSRMELKQGNNSPSRSLFPVLGSMRIDEHVCSAFKGGSEGIAK